MARGLTREMFSTTEADLKPDTAIGGAEQRCGEQLALAGFRDTDPRQKIINQTLLALRQRLAGGAAIEAVTLLGLLLAHRRSETTPISPAQSP
jgi:hypothetical protein